MKKRIVAFFKTKWSLKKKLLLFVLFCFALFFYFSLPDPLFKTTNSTIVYDSNDELLSARIASDGQWRFPASDALPVKFQECIIEFEDRYFFYHPGINLISMSKAFLHNLKGNGRKSGGSTITMQLARLASGNTKRTYWKKILEIILALRIECSYNKKSILNYYAAHAPFGGNVVGIHAASWRYFGREPSQLTWAETALIAVLPNAPALIYPGRNQTALVQKRNRLLKRLFVNGVLDETTYKLALLEGLPQKPRPLPQAAPHLLQRLIAENGEGKIYRSTLSKGIQETTSALLQNHVNILRNNGINNACAIILDTKTGHVLAYVGNSKSATRQDQNDVDILMASRSSGSILKPFLYAFLINDGLLTPHAVIEDVPMQIGSYAPKNYKLSYDGLVPASEALTRSLNVPSVKMLQMYGVPAFLHQLRKLGFSTITRPAAHYGLSLILGGAEVRPWEVAGIYASLGRVLTRYSNHHNYRSDDYHAPVFLKGSEFKSAQPMALGFLSAGSIWTTFNSMKELARPEEYSSSSSFSSLHQIAWKTGTSFGYRDAWAVGLNQKYTVVVWVGNADGEGRPGLTGINVAAPLMFSIFNALTQSTWFQAPQKDLVAVKTCRESGYRLSQNCPNTNTVQAPPATRKSPACSFHKIIMMDSSERFRVNSLCYPVSKMKAKSYFVLSPLQEFFYKQNHLEFVSRPPIMAPCADESNEASFDIVYPRNGYKIYLPYNENNQRNDLVMSATHNGKNAKLYWYLDKNYLGDTQHYHQMSVLASKGSHSLEITEEHGKSIKLNFVIIDK